MPSELVRRTVVVLNIKQIVAQHFYSKKKLCLPLQTDYGKARKFSIIMTKTKNSRRFNATCQPKIGWAIIFFCFNMVKLRSPDSLQTAL